MDVENGAVGCGAGGLLQGTDLLSCPLHRETSCGLMQVTARRDGAAWRLSAATALPEPAPRLLIWNLPRSR